jgi:glycosyltransferase involved in cell wall biosynthesis
VLAAPVRIAVLAPLVSPIAEPHVGGSQALLADLAGALAARGHEVRVYAATGSRIDGVDVVDTGVDAESLHGTVFRAAGGGEDPAAAVAARAAFETAARMIEGDRPDVVHAHAFDAPAIDAVATLGLPTIQVLHLPPAGDVADAVRGAAGAAFRVVTVSEAMRAAWAGAGVPAGVIRPGIPVDRIPWRAEAGSGLLFAGRLSPEKGALDAIAIASKGDAPLTIVGQPYDERHAAEVRTRAIAAGVDVRSPVRRDRLWELMANAAAVLCPIGWDEPFGLVAAESQAAGTPVVGYRRGALPEVVEDGVTGALVDSGDVDAAARAVRAVLRLDRREIRRHAERTLGLDASVEAFDALSAELAGARAGERA